MKNEAKREEKAVYRLTLKLPLQDESLDKAARSQKKKEISKESGVSERTLERYIAEYQANGLEGLKPNPSAGTKNRLPKSFDKALSEAVKLRK
jgi:transposase